GVLAGGGAGEGGARAAGLRGDLVVEGVVEHGRVEIVAIRVLPVHGQLGAGAGFGLQVGIAEHRRGALAAETDHAVVELGGLGRLEAGADAAFQRTALADVVKAIQARAELVAEHLVVVVAQARGERERLQQGPGVLGEDRVHVVLLHTPGGTGLHAEHTVGELPPDQLRADHRHVLASGLERDVDLRIQGVLRTFQGARRARQVAEQLLVLRIAQVLAQEGQLGGLGLVVPGVGAGKADRRAGRAVAVAADRAAKAGAGRVPDLLQLLPLLDGEGKGATLVAGVHARERDEAVGALPVAFVGDRPGVAGEPLAGRVAGTWLDPAAVADAQHRTIVVDRADRVFLHAGVVDLDRVVVFLARGVVV